MYKTGTIHLSVDYGYDIHTITFSKRTWQRVLQGKKLRVNGNGFYCEGVREKDRWYFNQKSIGSLHITTEDARDIYLGKLDDKEVWFKEI